MFQYFHGSSQYSKLCFVGPDTLKFVDKLFEAIETKDYLNAKEEPEEDEMDLDSSLLLNTSFEAITSSSGGSDLNSSSSSSLLNTSASSNSSGGGSIGLNTSSSSSDLNLSKSSHNLSLSPGDHEMLGQSENLIISPAGSSSSSQFSSSGDVLHLSSTSISPIVHDSPSPSKRRSASSSRKDSSSRGGNNRVSLAPCF